MTENVDMEIKTNSGTDGELRLNSKLGRPPKNGEHGSSLIFREDVTKAFHEAKRQYQETLNLPFDLTNIQFMAVLIQNLQQRQ